MIFAFAIQFVDLLVKALVAAIFLRIILSWFDQTGQNRIVRFLIDLSEPIGAPLRRVIPFVGPLDLSPMVAMILVQLVGGLVIQVLANAAYRY